MASELRELLTDSLRQIKGFSPLSLAIIFTGLLLFDIGYYSIFGMAPEQLAINSIYVSVLVVLSSLFLLMGSISTLVIREHSGFRNSVTEKGSWRAFKAFLMFALAALTYYISVESGLRILNVLTGVLVLGVFHSYYRVWDDLQEGLDRVSSMRTNISGSLKNTLFKAALIILLLLISIEFVLILISDDLTAFIIESMLFGALLAFIVSITFRVMKEIN